MINPRSIRFRLAVWYTSWWIAAFILFGVSMYATLNHYLEKNLRETLSRRAQQIKSLLLAGNVNENFIAGEIAARYTPESSGRYIRVTKFDGKVLYVSGAPNDQSFDPVGVPLQKKFPARESFRAENLPDGKRLLVSEVPIATASEKFLVEVGSSNAPIQDVLEQFLSTLVAGIPLLILAAAAGGYVLVRRALSPVDKITRSAEQITSHNLSDRLPVPQTDDEMERLSVALNHMIERLHDSFEYTRQFAVDASHELRTPLTIMRGELENLAQKQNLSSDAHTLIWSTLEEVERLTKIVEGLFALSRLDCSENPAEPVEFDLAKLAATTSEQMCLLAEDKGISVSCKTEENVRVRADRARIKQVIVNLLDNAIKYTSPEGAITLNVSARRDKAVMEVADTGIGIPSEALPRLFDRFFRVDKARSREMGGAGLGLAIVKSICAAHGGVVKVESIEGRGSRFIVELPLTNFSESKPHL